jgi:hypothetical protein
MTIVVADDEIKSRIFIRSHTSLANVGVRSPTEPRFVGEYNLCYKFIPSDSCCRSQWQVHRVVLTLAETECDRNAILLFL